MAAHHSTPGRSTAALALLVALLCGLLLAGAPLGPVRAATGSRAEATHTPAPAATAPGDASKIIAPDAEPSESETPTAEPGITPTPPAESSAAPVASRAFGLTPGSAVTGVFAATGRPTGRPTSTVLPTATSDALETATLAPDEPSEPVSPTPTATGTPTPPPTATPPQPDSLTPGATASATWPPTSTPLASQGATASASPTRTPTAQAAASVTPTATPTAPAALAGAGAVVINEVVTDPQLDWGGGGFWGLPGAGTATEADEFVELFIHTAGLNLAGWTIELTDSSPTSGDLTASGAFQVSNYFGVGSFNNTAAGDFLVLGNPRGGSMNNNILLVLRDAEGAVVDQVQIGAGGAPSGDATGPHDESISRIPNGVDTNDDIADFAQQAATLGAANVAGALPAPTATPGAYPPLAVVINEVAWAGTAASSSHEWMELHNPGGADIPLAGWTLTDGGGLSLAFTTQVIPAGGYLLLERTSDETVSDIPADALYTGALNDEGAALSLRDAHGSLIDTANGDGGPWPAGGGAPRASMERLGPGLDSDGNWHSNSGLAQSGLDAAGQPLRGTARAANSPPLGAPPEASATAPTPTATLAPDVHGVLINEFLPRPGAGGDEFIELINLSGNPVDLGGWQLDDAPGGTAPHRLAAGTVIQPGALLVFFRADTGVALNDDGDSARLLRPDGSVADAWSYTTAPAIGVSWARLPDGGAWSGRGQPTPGEPNRELPEQAQAALVPIGVFRGWPAGAWVTAIGRVSVPAQVFSPRTIQIEDATGGITVYLGRDDWPDLAVGRSVQVLGSLRHRNGNLELYVRNGWHVAAGAEDDVAAVAPRVAASGQVGEASEGALLSVTGRVAQVETSGFWLDDGSGPARVFFAAAAGLARPPVQRGQVWRVTGVVVEYTIATSAGQRYRLQPRFAGDAVLLNAAGAPAPTVPAPDDGALALPEPTETAQP